MRMLYLAVLIAAVLALAVLGGLYGAGYVYGWGPFAKAHRRRVRWHRGNRAKHASSAVEATQDADLTGSRILFLGSSVTYGAASLQDAIPEYFGRRFGLTAVKEAISGTTLVDNGPTSYVARLRGRLDAGEQYDLFICQLSTNDASKGMPLGSVSTGFDAAGFDTATVAGAMEWIIASARAAWNCPIAFYTNCRYDSARYGEMVDLLYQLADKWDIGVLDLWSDDAFNSISPADRKLFMYDRIHPTRAGYMRWWCPEMEKQLLAWMKTNR